MTTDQIPIGLFSRITQLSRKALRLYDERGLLVPGEKDLCTGYRYYTYAQIDQAIRIRNLTWLGFSLHEIEELLAARERGDARTIQALFSTRSEGADAEMKRLAVVQRILHAQDLNLEVFSVSLTEPVIKEVPAQRVLSKREKGVFGITIPKLIGEICSRLSQENGRPAAVKVVGPIMTIYHDQEYREEDADIEVALPIAGRITLDDPSIEVKNLPAGTFVSTIYTGPYQAIGKAHERIYSYVVDHGYVPDGPSRELYYNDPHEVPEDQLMTEIQFPIRKA
jgi:effector-binding domain-containing protein